MSTTPQFKNLAAVLQTAKARAKVGERPIPKPAAHEISVLNHAVAANPVDWKIQDNNFFVEKYPNVLGSDVCGTVIEIGDGVTHFNVGDRVTGFSAVIYNSNPDHGAFQTYTILRDIAASKIPPSMSFEEGSVFPMGFATAAIALFTDLKFPRSPAKTDKGDSALLVWGGSSSVGSSAVQIGKALGLKVFATASPANFDYVKSLGASAVFDYHDPNVVSHILAATKEAGVTITKGFDSISENGTHQLASDVLVGSGKGGELAIVLDWPAGVKEPEGVELLRTNATRSGLDQSELGAWFFNEWLEEAMAKGTVVPAPKPKIVDGGIGVTQKVFDMLKAGVSATKLVVKVDHKY